MEPPSSSHSPLPSSSPTTTLDSHLLSVPVDSREHRSPSVTISDEVESVKLILPQEEDEDPHHLQHQPDELSRLSSQSTLTASKPPHHLSPPPTTTSHQHPSQCSHCKSNEAIGPKLSALKKSLACGGSSSILNNHCESCKERGVTTTKCWCRDYRGILYSLVSGLASTFGGIIVRYMKDFDTFTLATYRFQGIVLPALIVVLWSQFVKKQNVFESVWPVTSREKTMKFGFTIIRAVIGCLGLYLYFYAIKLMPLADAKVILSCRTIFVIFVAHIFLGEQCGIFPVVTSMIAVVGVAVISRPPILTGDASFDSDTLMGTVFATLAMLAVTLSMVVLRYLRGVHVSIVTLAFGFWGTILSVICSVTVERFDIPQTGIEWLLIVCLAVSAFFSQTAITLAMKYENAGAVMTVGCIDCVMSFILQYFILGDAPDTYSILGATLIVICVSLITFRKWVSSLSERHSVRKRFWFLLK